MSGESDRAITGYLVERYGDFVLLRPPVKPKTYLLWFGPAIIILFAGAGVVRFLRRTGASGGSPEALNSAERRRVKSLISDEEVD
jgi:cytochrome c-type biogenesis protein CcmH